MTERMGRRLFVQGLRSMRASVMATSRTPIARRGMASHANEAKKSDLPWQIASGVVTLGGVAYLLTPPSKSSAHHVAAKHSPLEEAHKPASSEGGAARGESFTKAKMAEESAPTPVEDSEGTKADASEVKDSMLQAYKSDSPKDAKQAEEGSATESSDDSPDTRFDDGAPGMDDTGDKPEQKEKPAKEKTTSTDESQADMGEARAQSKEQNAPKEVKDKKTKDE